jgi:O-antigen ligase
LKKILNIYVIFSICWFAGVTLSNVDEGDVGGSSAGYDAVTLLIEMVIFGALFAYSVLYWRRLLRRRRHLEGPLPLICLTVASSLWSLYPSITFRRSVVLVVATFFAYFVGVMFDPAELIRLYRRVFTVMILGSIAVIGLLPSYGISHGVHGGDWKGAFFHKNRLGEMMAFAAIAFVLVPTERLPRLRRWAYVVMVLGLLYKSHSSTPVVSLAVVVAAQGIWYLLQMRRKLMSGVLLAGYPILAVVVAVVFAYSGAIFAFLGKDTTFSGRDRLWAGVIEGIKLRPLLGYGYLAFWNPANSLLLLIAERTTFVPPHAHDGYLNLMTHVGLVGLVLFLIFLVRGLVLAVRQGRATKSAEARWFFSFLIFMAAMNLTESQILEPFFFLWITMVALYVSFSIERAHGYDDAEEEELLAADQSRLISATP